MSGRSWKYQTRMKPGYTCGPDSLSEPCTSGSNLGTEQIVGVQEYEVITDSPTDRKRNLNFRNGLLAAIARSRGVDSTLPAMGQWLADSLERESAERAP
jgi:hypothetical protein